LNHSIYLHIPYCRRICPYCDFNKYVVKDINEQEYVSALKTEYLYYKKKYKLNKITSIYFGGGTPSIFSTQSIKKILDIFSFDQEAETTLEANPEDLNEESIKEIINLGVNRISLGSQSLNDKYLNFLGRVHKRKDILNICNIFEKLNFKNYNLDLIFGLPNQTIKELEVDIDDYLSLDLKHISAYQLTIEKGTEFNILKNNKKLFEINSDLKADMYQLIEDKLTTNNFNHYEVSNYSKANYQSKHNSAYWSRENYLGLGAGACSMIENQRFSNINSINEYLNKIHLNKNAKIEQKKLTIKEQIYEELSLKLRTSKGINIKEFNSIYKIKIEDIFKQSLDNFLEHNLIKIDNNFITPTKKGMMLVDSLILELNIEDLEI